VIAKARRLFAMSMGLLLLGFATVMLVLVYRSSQAEGTKDVHYAAGVLAVPAGAEVLSAVPSEGMFAITYRSEGAVKLRLIDGTTGAVLRDLDFVSQ